MSSPRGIGIIRVSQREDGAQSPEKQARSLLALATRSPWTLRPDDLWDENIDGNGHVRKAASGGADLVDRPTFLRAIESIERGEAQVICAERLDRLFRDLDVQRAVITRVEAAGGRIETVAGRTSHETAELELQANLNGSVAQYVRRTAKERSMAAVTQAIEQGKVPWSQTAPGYVRNDDSTLRPDPKLKPIIVKAFKMRDAGATIQAVREYLAEHGVQRSYHGTTHLLRDHIYLGEIHFKDRVNLTAHQAIIDRSLFERVQRIAVPRGRRAKSERLLARIGVLRCATCGARMVVGSSNNSQYYIYRCPPTGDCAHRVTISAQIVENMVIGYVKRRLRDIRGTATAADDVSDAMVDLERAQQALDAAITTFASIMVEPAVIKKLGELTETRNAARDTYEQAVTNSDATSIAVTVGDWDALTLDEQRALIKAVIDRVTVAPGRGPDRITIEPRASGSA